LPALRPFVAAIPANIYWTKYLHYRVAHPVGESELISPKRIAVNKHLDKKKPPRPRKPTRLTAQQESLCFELMASLASTFASHPQPFIGDLLKYARSKVVEGHIWLIKAVAKEEFGIRAGWDLITEGVFGLYEALDKFRPDMGTQFSTFAWNIVKEELQDYWRKQRQLGRHSSTDELAESGHESVLGLYSRDPAPVPEEYKIFSKAWGK
jgi:hypothetical protein